MKLFPFTVEIFNTQTKKVIYSKSVNSLSEAYKLEKALWKNIQHKQLVQIKSNF